jgi:glutamine synthetase
MSEKNFYAFEYIWLDGYKPVAQIRSKTRMVALEEGFSVDDLPQWSFDGSSTSQAQRDDSDCLLKPVCMVEDPLMDGGDYLVLCEVLNPDGSNHPTNTRAQLRKVLDQGAAAQNPWFGFEQEYTLFKHNRPLGWPEHGFPAPQGPYYCGVGTRQIFGRDIAMEHMHACLGAGLMYYGLNAEVMPGQWEFQIGYRGEESEPADALTVTDHMWIARWLMHRISESHGVHVSLENKPMKGDWNGAGMHTNFSTQATRTEKTGKKALEKAIERLANTHKEHIKVYGHGLEERLTGLHETSSIHEFSHGGADRGRSIRIPAIVNEKGYGYIEDRRPGANADPYLVAARIIETVCDVIR